MAVNMFKGIGKKAKGENLTQDKTMTEQLDVSYLGKVTVVEATQEESSKGTQGIRLVLETQEDTPRRVYYEPWLVKADGDLLLFNVRTMVQICTVLGLELDKLKVVSKGDGDNAKDTLPQLIDAELNVHLQHKWEKATQGNSIGKYFCKHEIQSVFQDNNITLGEAEDDIIKPQRYPKAVETVAKWNLTKTKPSDEHAPIGNQKAKVKSDNSGEEEEF